MPDECYNQVSELSQKCEMFVAQDSDGESVWELEKRPLAAR
jgi:hypothetical protein